MADSLFDNRYRYDYIYPRGRSGETLRAVDTHDGDRPVVIKRPAPHDAPPIRSGQEVSILNERKALARLAGHPALTELLGGGQFFVSGIVHQYIVVERAQGSIVQDMVRELAARGERMPELEMLVIVDVLLDLLHAAHARDIVYNDVDAKHLFWDREHYHLKVIDWGNAVLLEGDEATPQGVSRQSDIFQVGELLYFIVTGGMRMEVPRDAGEDFRLSFGPDDARISPRLQAIISRAAHPNTRLRYRLIGDLRKDLQDYRTPLERERDGVVTRVLDKLRQNRSKEELNGLLQTLEPALMMDPGFPEARRAFTMIEDRLSDLEVAGDLDAARIYLESANWGRAANLLDELRGRTRGDTATFVKLLRDWARMLERSNLQPAPLAVMDAIALAFDGEMPAAAHALLTQDSADERVRTLGLLLTERVAAHYQDVAVLRPNLQRLVTALDELAAEQQPLAEARSHLNDILETLDTLPGGNGGLGARGRRRAQAAANANLVTLRDGYRSIVDQLMVLGTVIDSAIGPDTAAQRRVPYDSLERAAQAAMTLADNMHVIGKQAVGSPRDARAALESSRAIDPSSPAWDVIQKLLDGLYELLQSYQTYVPAADGSDVADWLTASRRDLFPFSERLFDEMLAGMIAGLSLAAENWALYADAAIVGSRVAAVTALANATEAVGTVSPTLAGWFNHIRTNVANAAYVERYALYGALGRVLADGWENFDKGRLPEAERLGAQAYEAARSESEQTTARRLRDLAEAARLWVERGGASDITRSKQTLQTVEAIFTNEERAARLQFTNQMPSRDTYLRAMGKGLVELFGRNSSAAVRTLYVSYILQGAVDAAGDKLEEVEFWREAAIKTLGDAGARHPLMRTLMELAERRRDLREAAALINSIDNPSKLPTLENARKLLEENRQAKTLAAAVYSLRELEAGARDWADGEFRAAGIKIENAVKAIDDVENQAQITLTHYRAWLLELLNNAAELHNQMRKMQQVVEQRPEQPDATVRAAQRGMVDATERLLGSAYANTLRQWRDTYEQFLSIYEDKTIRRSAKLARFNDLFRALFIDRHPAYPLYRHWYNLTDAAPEFPAPPTDEPTPQLAEVDEAIASGLAGGRRVRARSGIEEAGAGDAPAAQGASVQRDRRGIPRWLLIAIPVLIIAAVAAFALLNGQGAGGMPTPQLTDPGLAVLAETANETPVVTETPAPTTTPTIVQAVNTLPPRPTNTPGPTATPTPITPTATGLPTNTPTATDTRPPTLTATPSTTPLPPQGVQGVQSLLTLVGGLENAPWTVEQFGAVQEGAAWRLGVGGMTGGATIVIPLARDILDARFGNSAAQRIISMEADMRLETYNPPLLIDDLVYFGIMLQSVGSPAESAGVQINLAGTGVVNIGQRVGDVNAVIGQRSLGDVRLRLRLDYNPETGAVTTFVNGEPIGLPLTLEAPLGVQPALFVKDGGVIVYVSSWTVALR